MFGNFNLFVIDPPIQNGNILPKWSLRVSLGQFVVTPVQLVRLDWRLIGSLSTFGILDMNHINEGLEKLRDHNLKLNVEDYVEGWIILSIGSLELLS